MKKNPSKEDESALKAIKESDQGRKYRLSDMRKTIEQVHTDKKKKASKNAARKNKGKDLTGERE